MKLSILICHLKSRDEQLVELMKILEPQKNDDVEILIETDEGGLTVGAKRNNLLDRAKGDYICFVDDDDRVPAYYVEEILKAIEPQDGGNSPDSVGMWGYYIRGDQPPKKFIHSIQHGSWFEQDGVFYRPPNHLNPVKRELALKTRFPEKDHGEDHEYSMKMLKVIDIEPEFTRTEVFVDKVMYFYYD